MKKSIALFLVVILLIGIIGTALAACGHSNRHIVGSYTVTTKQTIAKQHGCIKLSNPHTHWRYKYEHYYRYLCYTCGDVSSSLYSTTYGSEHCPKD